MNHEPVITGNLKGSIMRFSSLSLNLLRRTSASLRNLINLRAGTGSGRILQGREEKNAIMKLNTKAVAISCGVLWGGAALTSGIANLVSPRYAREFLRVLASIYPGYNARRTPGQVALVTACALADGALGGALYAAIYNRVSESCGEKQLTRVA